MAKEESKKSAKEASSTYHNIMKASVSSKIVDNEPVECPTCGAIGVFIPPTKKDGKKLHVTFKCDNGHTFKKTYELK